MMSVSHKMTNFRYLYLVSCTGLLLLISSCASNDLKNGRDWGSMKDPDKEAFCSIIIYRQIGFGYPTKLVKASSNHLSRSISKYYNKHSGRKPISIAIEESWIGTINYLDLRLRKYRNDEKNPSIIFKTRTKIQNSYPDGIGSIKIGDSKHDVYNKLIESKKIRFSMAFFYDFSHNFSTSYSREGTSLFKIYTNRSKFIQIANVLHSQNNNFFDVWNAKVQIRDEVYLDTIELFNKEFEIEWLFGQNGILREIKLHTTCYYKDGLRPMTGDYYKAYLEVKKFNDFVVDIYAEKYSKPDLLKTYPDFTNSKCHNVARWTSKDIETLIYVCEKCSTRSDGGHAWLTKTSCKFVFFIRIFDENYFEQLEVKEKIRKTEKLRQNKVKLEEEYEKKKLQIKDTIGLI